MNERDILKEWYEKYETDGDEDRMSLVEHITDKYNQEPFEKSDVFDDKNRKWRDRYEDLSARYKQRFFYGEEVSDKERENSPESEEAEYKKTTFEDLFERRK